MGAVEGIKCEGRSDRGADVIRGEIAAAVKNHVTEMDVC